MQSSARAADPDFGPNVTIFDSGAAKGDIEAKCNAIYSVQERNEFGPQRNAILFKPGSYDAVIKVGYYTQVYGLGQQPDDVIIKGEVHSDANAHGHNATVNFWRGCENLAIEPTHSNTWAVSQAAPFRRVHVKGELLLFDQDGWSSGGFMADTKIDGKIIPGSQQQWFSRNSQWDLWTNGVWNMVFMGCVGVPTGTWPDKPYTVIDKTPIIREKPYLTVDNQGNWSVYVPTTLHKDSSGISWDSTQKDGSYVPLSQFYIAREDKDTATTLNAALAAGKHLLLTPGIYKLDAPLKVTNPDTVILGIGMPTLNPVNGTSALEIADVNGVRVACVLFDAGAKSSPVLLQVGEAGSHQSHAADPSMLFDIFCRVGGGVPGQADTCVVINSSDVIGDHAWIWRADHGAGSGWTSNPSTNGLIVNGDNVTYYGLFVEHFEKDQVLWNGENGRTYFFQSELPYDPPTQADWTHGNVKGYPAYKVADNVKVHEAVGLGIYCVFQQDNIFCDNAIEAPKTPGVKFTHALTMRLSGKTENSGINSVINGTGEPSSKAKPKTMVLSYP